MVSEDRFCATRIVCEVRPDNMKKPAKEFEIGRVIWADIHPIVTARDTFGTRDDGPADPFVTVRKANRRSSSSRSFCVCKLLPRRRAFADTQKSCESPAPDRSHIDEIAKTVHAREISTTVESWTLLTRRLGMVEKKKEMSSTISLTSVRWIDRATFSSPLDDRRDDYAVSSMMYFEIS